MACSDTSMGSSLRSSFGGSGLGQSSQSSAILLSEKQSDPDHSSSRSHNTAPTRRSGDAKDVNTCTALDLRPVSPLVRSRTLFVRRRLWCD